MLFLTIGMFFSLLCKTVKIPVELFDKVFKLIFPAFGNEG